MTDKIDREWYGKISPIEPIWLNILGGFLVIMMIMGVTINTFLLNVFRTNKELRTPLYSYITAITVLNLIGSFTQLPWIIHSCFSHRWTTGRIGCDISSTFMFFIGCSSAYLMTAISFERFYIMYKPLNIRKLNFKLAYTVIGICIAIGVFWSLMPLLGWSYYTYEAGLVSCAVEFKGNSWNVRSFIIAIFIFVYCIPFGTISISNIVLLIIVRRMSSMNEALTSDAAVKKRLEVQAKITNVVIIYISGFIISWTPYAIVSFYTGFIDENAITPLGATMPAFFMKSSMIWSSLFFTLTNPNIRSKLFFFKKQNTTTNSTQNT